MKHDVAIPFTSTRQARGSRLFAGWATGFALTARTAPALVPGITEGVSYRATDRQIEARFGPIADALSKAMAWTAGFTHDKVSFLSKDLQPISNWSGIMGKHLVTPRSRLHHRRDDACHAA